MILSVLLALGELTLSPVEPVEPSSLITPTSRVIVVPNTDVREIGVAP